MRSGSLKLVKGLLIATAVSVVTPVTAAGLVMGIAGATEAVSRETNKAVFGEKPQATPVLAQASSGQPASQSVTIEPVATRDPTPLSPLAAVPSATATAPSAPQIAAANVQRVLPR